jgi:hypothetical protein
MTTHACIAAALAALAVLAGCGKSAEPDRKAAATPVAAKKVDPAKPTDGSPPPRCPVKVEAALTGPDVVGLKLGMLAEDALNFIRCQNKDVVVTYEDRWIQNLQSYGLKLGHQMFVTRAGDTAPCSFKNYSDMQKCGPGNVVWNHLAESVTVATPGIPGQEKVFGVWRTQRFKPAEMPPVASIVAALIAKYGQPQRTLRSGDGTVLLNWVADAKGTALAPPGREFFECARVQARAEDPQQWTDGCGMTVSAQVNVARDNVELAREVHVGMLHQQSLYRFGRELQSELAALDGMRRAREVEKAKGATASVKL